jgi:glycogen synthase
MKSSSYRIFCVNGPGDSIRDYLEDPDDPRSITFKSQFIDFCRSIDAEAYIVAYHQRKAIYRVGKFTIEHRPKPMPGASGVRYHLAQALYALSLFFTAVRFRANVAVLDSGTSHYFMLALFRLANIKVVMVLHNTLWPADFPPSRSVAQALMKIDALFLRFVPIAIIGVSPECIRQVNQVTRGVHGPDYQVRALFRRDYFEAIPAPPLLNELPFRILFLGRITRDKGTFDILEMAKKIEAQRPGRVQWEVYGVGPDLENLERRHRELGLDNVVFLRGWVSPRDADKVYAKSHVSIVPTRSVFCEGMAMAAIESVLAGRPVITCPVVPALEVLRPACVEAQTDDVDSYVEAILRLIDHPTSYDDLCRACRHVDDGFYDLERGYGAALKKIFTKL